MQFAESKQGIFPERRIEMYGNEIEMDSLVSVIVPIYKVECYLRKCVDSILNQTYKNLEIILVDDGSPDRCGEICDEYAKIDSRITVIHKQNGGLSDARNAGIDAAHGEYIMFVDSDDYIAETMVEKLYRALISYDAEMSLCSFLYVDEKGVPIPKMNSNRPIKNVVLSGRQAIGCLCKDKGWYYTIACCKLYNKNLWKETRFPKGKYHEDEFVSHILFGKCKRIACIEEYLYYYFQRPDSIMGKSKNSNTIKSFDVAEAFINRAVYIEKLGLNDDAGKYYFDAAFRISKLLTHYQPKFLEEKARMKEMYKILKENRFLGKYCTPKEKLHIALICVSPRFHQIIIKILGN